jgi:diguanylate cyclase
MSDPAFEELDPDYAAALADRANRYMVQHGVTPTPGNFAVWFAYSRDASPELKRAIDALIAGKKLFDANTNRELFATYLAPSSASKIVGNIPEQLKSVMTAAKRFVTAAIADGRTHIRAIGGVAEQAENGGDPKSLIESLMSELAKAATRASELETNLSETSRELDAIRASLNEAEQRANTDTLTGLPNRRALDEFLRASQLAAMENSEPLSVLLIDIDRFKQFNDKFGHGVGDQLLRLMANALRERLGGRDMPARYGGEELIAVLPGAKLAACEAMAELIRKSVSKCRITRRSTGDSLPGVTVSIGVAQFRPGESTAELVERCDRARSLAKRIGRNRVVTEIRLEGRAVPNASSRDLCADHLDVFKNVTSIQKAAVTGNPFR